jgi:hypothetical protein
MGHQSDTHGTAAHSGDARCGLKSRAVAKEQRREAMHRRGERRGERGVKKSAFASAPRRVGRHTWLTVTELGPPVCSRVAGTHTRPATGRPVKWCLTLTSGPWPLFDFFQDF